MPVDYPATEDQVLLAHIVNRQTEALSALYDRYGRLLYSVAYHLVGNQQLAEEITLDVFRRVWEKAGSYKADRASVRTWLTSMTRNRAIDMLRREGVRPEHTSISWADLTFEPHADGHSPETAVSQKMQNQRIHAALAELPEEQQEVLLMAFFNGYSHSQIADHLTLPLGTVKTRIRLGMHKLKLVLQP
ncbi:MAG: sigma-70 family RNA polymerase sigma factor [Anaerolineales bacterium]|nr:sigma-70 family RNA polymerase sigma factor [Anaerolineales bacterium]MCB8938151.1 sigma-70 family RNA polymerase sigma factor [Ardenticatenaceae bacterium]